MTSCEKIGIILIERTPLLDILYLRVLFYIYLIQCYTINFCDNLTKIKNCYKIKITYGGIMKKNICLILIIICSIFLCSQFSEHKIYKSFYQEEVTFINSLKDKYQNDDVVGLLNIPNTNINEVIVQGSDNDYYLSHDAYKKNNIIGSTYLDYRTKINEGRKNLIYSHNSSSLDVPFKTLENYYDEEYFSKHQFIYLNDVKYQIFSVFIEVSDWSYMNINFENDTKWEEHLQNLKNKSWYDTKVDVKKEDNILILQTCSHHKDYKKYKNKYLLVIAKKI